MDGEAMRHLLQAMRQMEISMGLQLMLKFKVLKN